MTKQFSIEEYVNKPKDIYANLNTAQKSPKIVSTCHQLGDFELVR